MASTTDTLRLPGGASEEWTVSRRLERGSGPHEMEDGVLRSSSLAWGPASSHLPDPCGTSNNHTVTNKKSGGSQATDASGLYEKHFNLTQMGLLTDNLIQQAP